MSPFPSNAVNPSMAGQGQNSNKIRGGAGGTEKDAKNGDIVPQGTGITAVGGRGFFSPGTSRKPV